MSTLILATSPLLDKAPELQKYYREVVIQTILSAVADHSEMTLAYASEITYRELRELLNTTTHIVVPGGDDVHPSFYGGDAEYEGSGTHNQKADEIQIAAAQHAAANKINYLGICRGLQVLNVSMGGTLHQHIPAHQKKLDHTDYEKRFTEHTIVVPEYHAAINPEHPVHCAHHQTVDKLGTELEAIAYADNGHIEAVQMRRESKILGVQYHPEATASKNTHLTSLVSWFYTNNDTQH